MLQALWIQGEKRRLIDWPRERALWAEGSGVLWIDLQGPTQEQMEALGRELGLNPYVVRACLHPEHRAKLKEFKHHFLLVLNAVGRGLSEHGGSTELGRWRAHELNVVAGERFVLTVHPESIATVSLLFQRTAKEHEGSFGATGQPHVDYLVFAIAEAVTSGYYLMLDRLDGLIEEAEGLIFSGKTGPEVVDKLFTLKKHILYLRRILGPQRDAVGTMMRRDLPQIPPESRPFFMDVYEHTLRLFDLLDTYRDLISSSLDAYLSTVSNRTNEIMKTLTIVSTIMLPLTLIAGVFGMNFARIPFAEKAGGFLFIVGGMLALGAAMTLYFKRRGWF